MTCWISGGCDNDFIYDGWKIKKKSIWKHQLIGCVCVWVFIVACLDVVLSGGLQKIIKKCPSFKCKWVYRDGNCKVSTSPFIDRLYFLLIYLRILFFLLFIFLEPRWDMLNGKWWGSESEMHNRHINIVSMVYCVAVFAEKWVFAHENFDERKIAKCWKNILWSRQSHSHIIKIFTEQINDHDVMP